MRRLFAAAVLLCVFLSTHAVAQGTPPLRIGAQVAGNMMNGPFDLVRAGGQVMIPFSARLYARASLSRFVGGAKWEVSAALRYRPLGPADGSSPLYVGAGLTAINWGPQSGSYDLWLTGLEIPQGRFRPYIELQFLGPVHRLINTQADFGVQAFTGFTWAVR